MSNQKKLKTKADVYERCIAYINRLFAIIKLDADKRSIPNILNAEGSIRLFMHLLDINDEHDKQILLEMGKKIKSLIAMRNVEADVLLAIAQNLKRDVTE